MYYIYVSHTMQILQSFTGFHDKYTYVLMHTCIYKHTYYIYIYTYIPIHTYFAHNADNTVMFNIL